jgi:hypothetical protein
MKSISELSLDNQLKLLGLKLSVGVIEDINIANNNFVINGENRDVYWLLTKDVDVYIIGTGQTFDASNKLYIGSCMTENGNFVWHIFIDYSKSENIILPGIDL